MIDSTYSKIAIVDIVTILALCYVTRSLNGCLMVVKTEFADEQTMK